MRKKTTSLSCAVCGQTFRNGGLTPGALVRKNITDLISAEHPDWAEESYICQTDLANYRSQYVHSLLESEKGELTELEKEVLESMRQQEILSADIDSEFEQEWNFGERLADRIASFGGSWSFLIIFAILMSLWIVMNSLVLYWQPVDPFPYILLNLVLSCLASVQAPIIMMSQNRQEAKDRIRARHDYQVNLKAELEIRHLHEKMDHLLTKQWERLVQIQEIQMELIGESRKGR
jgi:uncharacterized membrane protein